MPRTERRRDLGNKTKEFWGLRGEDGCPKFEPLTASLSFPLDASECREADRDNCGVVGKGWRRRDQRGGDVGDRQG